MDVEDLKKRLNDEVDRWFAGQTPEVPEEIETPEEPRTLPKDKRVVRTKASGDRVYLIDEVKKTRAWLTNPEVLKASGFEIGDVQEVNDDELLTYQMSPAIYRVET